MELEKRRMNPLKIPIFVFFGVLVLGLAIIFGLFHIRQVDVAGNEFYSADEIQNMVMKGSLAENSIYLTWKYRDDSAAADLPFLNSVEVTMLSPYHVKISVHEKTIVGYVMYNGSLIYFDSDGKVMEISAEQRDGILPFSGVAIGQPAVGEDLPVTTEGLFDEVVEAARLIKESTLQPDEAHFDDKQNLILYFGNNRVMMGSSSYLEEKIEQLEMIYPELEKQEASGTLHLETYVPGTTTFSLKVGERGEEESELIINSGSSSAEDGETQDGSDAAADGETTDESESETSESTSGYVEDSSRITTDADGNQIYTDEQGNTTSNMDQAYLGDDGEVWSDGYGYIDPYTGAYILNE